MKLGIHWVILDIYIYILGSSRDNGKDNGNHWDYIGSRV